MTRLNNLTIRSLKAGDRVLIHFMNPVRQSMGWDYVINWEKDKIEGDVYWRDNKPRIEVPLNILASGEFVVENGGNFKKKVFRVSP